MNKLENNQMKAFDLLQTRISNLIFEISVLKGELSDLAIKSEIKDENDKLIHSTEEIMKILSPLSKNIQNKQQKLEELEMTAKLFETNETIEDRENYKKNRALIAKKQDAIIPVQALPMFVDTYKRPESLHIYNDVSSFLKRFETIIGMYDLDVDQNFEKYLPACFSNLEYDWVMSNIIYDEDIILYDEAKEALIKHYSRRSIEEESIRVWHTKMAINEPLHKFADRFVELVASTKTPVTDVLVNHFIRLLPVTIQKDIERTKASNPNITYSLRQIADLAIVFHRIENSSNYQYSNQLQLNQHNNYTKPRTRYNNSNRYQAENEVFAEKDNIKQISFENFKSDRDYPTATTKIDAVKNNSFIPTCYKCSGPHYANTCNKPKNDNFIKNINNNNNYNKSNNNYNRNNFNHDSNGIKKLNNIKVEGAEVEVEDSSVEDYKNIVESFEDLSYDLSENLKLNQLNINSPKILNKTCEVLPQIPITINDYQIMAMIDTGAQVSFIDKELTKALNLEVLETNGDIILAEQLKIRRVGRTEPVKLKTTDVELTCSLELTELNENKVIIGMDLLFKLGIGLVGLPIDFPIELKIDSKVPREDKRIEEEKLAVPDCILGAIDRNEDIKITSFCTLPESVITLPTINNSAVYRRQYNIPEMLKKEVDNQVNNWLSAGTIKLAPVNTNYNNPLTIVSKKDKEGNKTKFRVCIDPRLLNNILVDDKYPLPLIKDIFKELKNSSYYTKIDLKDAFNSLRIVDEDQVKTAFSWNNTQYVFVGCPFGIKTIPNKFQRITNNITKGIKALGYLDDIIIYSESFEEHKREVKNLIEKLTSCNLRINFEKSEFFKKETILLGFRISTKGISIDPKKIEQIQRWPLPTSGKQLEQYLGLINYFRNHIPRSSTLLSEFNELKKVDKFELSNKLKNQFYKLIQLIVEAPTLIYADDSKEFKLATDASNTGISAVLFQGERFKESFISFNARVLNKHEKNYSTTKKELLAIIYGLKEFNDYIYGRKITIYTDHKALVYLKTQKNLNSMLNNWLEILNSYNYDIIHLPGIHNILPDCLSRIFIDASVLNKNVNNKKDLLHKKKSINENEVSNNNIIVKDLNKPVVNPLLAEIDEYINEQGSQIPHIEMRKANELDKELLNVKSEKKNKKELEIAQEIPSTKKDEYREPKDESLTSEQAPSEEQRALMLKYHLNGHFGANKLYSKMAADNIKWKGLKQDLLNFVRSCTECARNTIQQKGYHPLTPINSRQQLDHIAIDLLGPLQTTIKGNNYVLLMVDVFSRFVFLFSIPDKQAETIATKLLKVFFLFGFPKIIQSDNGTEFKNKLMNLICKNSNIDHRLISAYHPRSNGLAERNVQTVTHMLRKLIQGNKRNWDNYINLIQFYINNNINKIHASAPFELMFGRKCNAFEDYRNAAVNEDHMEQSELFNRMQNVVLPAINKKIVDTQIATKTNFDNKKNEVFFKVNDFVMTINLERKTKLDPLYNGPFQVVKVNDYGTYSLMNPDGTLLNRNYPPNQLKLVAKNNIEDSFEIKKILDDRVNNNVKEYLVEWMDSKDQTWIPYNNFNEMKFISEYEDLKYHKKK